MRKADLIIFDSDDVRARLGYAACIEVVREAMQALSAGRTRQLLRSVLEVGEDKLFGLMPGALAADDMFGAKLISVFPEPGAPGIRRHRGVIAMFEPEQGQIVCLVDAEEVTHIRTAAATAVATDALARKDAKTLLVMGTGGQAATHLKALPHVREFERIEIWGRSPEKAAQLVARFADRLPVTVAEDAQAAAGRADVICTVTGSREPVLLGEWLRPGTHVNLVGSSVAGPVEVDSALVAMSRYVADSRASALAAGAEFLVAKEAGLVGDDHVVGEIGEVLLGTLAGRQSDEQITAYKSLGHAVQDLAAAAYIYRSASAG